MVRSFVFVLTSAFLAGCSVFGIRSGTEQAPYQVIDRLGPDIEIRRYGNRLAAQVEIPMGEEGDAMNKAFRVLADYIFGANQASARISMTAPVEVDSSSVRIAMTAPVEASTTDGEHLSMRFFLPAKFTLDTVPRPLDPRVGLVEIPGETLAALRYSGLRDAERDRARRAALLAALKRSDWQPTAAPVSYYYDPPWTLPFLRRNESVVAVKRLDAPTRPVAMPPGGDGSQ